MANFEDYLPGGAKDPNGGLDAEINDAQNMQEARQRDPATGQFTATPIDWEQRYKELEKLNSRQAQTLGDYRKVIDEFIQNPTPAEATPQEELSPITAEDLYENPNEAVMRAVESHPAIREARELKQKMVAQERQSALDQFATRHGDYQEIGGSPEFQNWVAENPMRMELFQRADSYDFSAADALFSLYKAERGMRAQSQANEAAHAELVSSSGELVQEPPRYSRSEYIDKLTAAKQGDLKAEDWVKRNAAGYRQALASGNVRD